MNPEILARVAWAMLTEPNDHCAGIVLSKIGAPESLELLKRFSDCNNSRARMVILDALMEEGIKEQTAVRAIARWTARFPQINPAAVVRGSQAIGAEILTPEQGSWPRQVNDLGNGAPHCLWVSGSMEVLQATYGRVSLVGSRAQTAYGEYVTQQFSSGLVDRGAVVVSGGAFGVDATAHKAALGGRGRTMAVMAGGVDRLYPAGNSNLLQKIREQGGALVSESPPGALPMKSRFLSRNRIIAAISGTTVVIEAAWRSGALSTAHHALELGRILGVVPGQITSAQSAGCHRLLKETPAEVVASVDDLLVLVGGAENSMRDTARATDSVGTNSNKHCGNANEILLSALELRVLDAFSTKGSLSIEEIAVNAGVLAQEVFGVIGRLELEGLVTRDIFGWVRR